MSYVRLQTNIPIEAALKFDNGKVVQSQIDGTEQVMFTLQSDEAIYVPKHIADKMALMGIRKGVPFRIGKREVTNGAKKRVEWFVEPTIEQQLEESVRQVQASKAPAPAPAPPQAQAPGPFAVPPQTRPSPSAEANLMAASLMHAVDAAILAESYAASRNHAITFSAEDIRTIAATIYIQQSKGQVTSWRQ